MIYDDNGGMLPKLYEDVLHTTTIHTNAGTIQVRVLFEAGSYHSW